VPIFDYPESFRELTRQLRRLPSIGPRGAERIALWMLLSPHAHPEDLAGAIHHASQHCQSCEQCGFFSEQKICSLCADETRSGKEFCIVERATDILPLERTGVFHGRYHALGGKLSPLDGIGPEQLRITELMDRLCLDRPSEIILALSGDVEGEATAHFLAEMIAPLKIKITRLAQGLSAGSAVEQADTVTLQRALVHRAHYSF